MQNEFIQLREFCRSHNIEESFIISLQEYELVSLKVIGDNRLLHIEELPKLEKMVRLHHELHINLEGIEAIYHLLERTLRLQNEIHTLKKRLNRQEII